MVVHNQSTAFATVANIASGTGWPAFARFQSRIAMIIKAAHTHEPTTTSTSPR